MNNPSSHRLVALRFRYPAIAAAALPFVLFAQGCATQPSGDSAVQTRFNSPDAAAQALVQALRRHDQEQLHRIFGSEGDEILASGDDVADQKNIETFLQEYDEKHRLVADKDGSVTLSVGSRDWPLPIPIVKNEKDNTWAFDTAAGKEEMLNRRIGQNELDVIEVCKAIVDAQNEYAFRDLNDDGIPEFAQQFVSDPGKKNGLYWETGPGEPPSPMGPFVAEAVEEGYSSSPSATNEPRPYHGYCYRLLKSQGPNAPGGAYDYMVNGRLIAGFAVVAYPAEYGNSGIMTFLVNSAGTLYQKDLGPDTKQIARAMQSFDPGPEWKRVATPENAEQAGVGSP